MTLTPTPPPVLDPDPLPRLDMQILAARNLQLQARRDHDTDQAEFASKLLNACLEQRALIVARRLRRTQGPR